MSRKVSDEERAALAPETLLVTAGRDPSSQHGFVNPPVYHGSTVLYPNAADLLAHRARYQYGRRGTPTSEALQDALRELEGPQCAGVALLPSGLNAISTALLAVVAAGDHLLVSDNVYRPTRRICDTALAKLGVVTTYFDPMAADAYVALFRPNTRAVFLEAPGSQSFEMADIPHLSGIAHEHDAVVLVDNTWATPLFCRPLEKGADLAIQAGTKYIVGHSDVMLGTVSANAALLPPLQETVTGFGLCVGPDDIYLALRGLRTMAVRLERHQTSGLAMARWLQGRPEVARVLHPALESDPGHAIWKRDFTGASGLFSIVLNPAPEAAVHAMLDSLTLFGMGFSWGGYESLVIPFDCSSYRSATEWNPGGPTLRVHIGLEDVGDLIADLERGFERLAPHAT